MVMLKMAGTRPYRYIVRFQRHCGTRSAAAVKVLQLLDAIHAPAPSSSKGDRVVEDVQVHVVRTTLFSALHCISLQTDSGHR